jgi:hypothetical protein
MIYFDDNDAGDKVLTAKVGDLLKELESCM